jgi:hypothetical protein
MGILGSPMITWRMVRAEGLSLRRSQSAIASFFLFRNKNERL